MTTDSTLKVAHTLTGLPVSDMARAEDWYGKLFGKPADAAPMESLLDFRMSKFATVQIVLDAECAGAGMLTLDVASIDDAVAGIQAPAACALSATTPPRTRCDWACSLTPMAIESR